MKIDALVAEIGSTTTVVNAFNGIRNGNAEFLGQGQARTSVEDGDVNLGLSEAIEDLKLNLREDSIEYGEVFATSSAAGGLRMTVHGLVYEMTVRAAKEAALGAGANLKMVTAGKMRRKDVERLTRIHPNIILIAGGVDYGERETSLHNAEVIAMLDMGIPVIYAGNIENKDEIREIFDEKSENTPLYIAENVYPKIDLLNVEPTRKIIQDVFEEHIVHAPGMEKIKTMVDSSIIPTPGAVMAAAKVLKEFIGDLVVFDVGGATTDIHSVTSGSEEINRILISPEPEAKRTVEGDLGVYVNMLNIIEIMGEDELERLYGDDKKALLEGYRYVPKTSMEIDLVERMASVAAELALDRHSGCFREIYGTGGKKTLAEGKDLSAVKWVIGTGGVLTRLPGGKRILSEVIKRERRNKLNPLESAKVLLDNDYTMASLGVLSRKYPEAAMMLLKKSFREIQ